MSQPPPQDINFDAAVKHQNSIINTPANPVESVNTTERGNIASPKPQPLPTKSQRYNLFHKIHIMFLFSPLFFSLHGVSPFGLTPLPNHNVVYKVITTLRNIPLIFVSLGSELISLIFKIISFQGMPNQIMVCLLLSFYIFFIFFSQYSSRPPPPFLLQEVWRSHAQFYKRRT